MLFCRLALIQLGDSAGMGRNLAENAARRWDASFSAEEYQRGELLDRYGESLTDSRIASRLVVFPATLDIDGVIEADLGGELKTALGLRELEELKTNKSWQIYYQMEDQRLLRKIEEAAIPGLSVLPIKLRYGPDSLARHLTGYMSRAEESGVFGLEKEYDQYLRGGGAELVTPQAELDAWLASLKEI